MAARTSTMLLVAWMVAMALQLDGWYLRSDIIWHKPNCQPESVKDRVTVSHEYLFMFSKSEVTIQVPFATGVPVKMVLSELKRSCPCLRIVEM